MESVCYRLICYIYTDIHESWPSLPLSSVCQCDVPYSISPFGLLGCGEPLCVFLVVFPSNLDVGKGNIKHNQYGNTSFQEENTRKTQRGSPQIRWWHSCRHFESSPAHHGPDIYHFLKLCGCHHHPCWPQVFIPEYHEEGQTSKRYQSAAKTVSFPVHDGETCKFTVAKFASEARRSSSHETWLCEDNIQLGSKSLMQAKTLNH